MTDTAPPKLRYETGSVVVPGDRIGQARLVTAGPGTYSKGGQVYASLAGKLQISQEESWQVSVTTLNNKQIASSRVVRVGQVVLCRVLRIASQQATVEIVAIQSQDAAAQVIKDDKPEGVIRREDISQGAVEQPLLQDSFASNDLVLARVLSLGDNRRYFLTTAESELGVLYALSATSGQPMVPKSYKEMQCLTSGATELRKCAKPRDLMTNIEESMQEGE